MTIDLLRLICNSLASHQFRSLSNSALQEFSNKGWEEFVKTKQVSSAKSRKYDVALDKRRGPKIDHWGTPMVIGLVVELQLLESELVHVCHNGKAFEEEFCARWCLCEGPWT